MPEASLPSRTASCLNKAVCVWGGGGGGGGGREGGGRKGGGLCTFLAHVLLAVLHLLEVYL